jgi:hypothetical protein
MPKIERFEDIEAWVKARGVARNVYTACSQGGFSRDFGLRDQIQRAAVSIMSNIAEGFERGTNKEFIQFLIHCKRFGWRSPVTNLYRSRPWIYRTRRIRFAQ